ncbi:unnamed protein product, partial [Rotaria sp. Silwood1]
RSNSCSSVFNGPIVELDMQRLTFGKEHEHWLDEWNNVMWSDEAHFEVSSRKNGTYIYRLKSEINQLFNFIPRVQGGRGGCVSVWGCISGGAHGPLVVHNDRLNGPAYIKVIKEALPCFIQNAFDKSNTDWVYMQDNAACHTSKYKVAIEGGTLTIAIVLIETREVIRRGDHILIATLK